MTHVQSIYRDEINRLSRQQRLERCFSLFDEFYSVLLLKVKAKRRDLPTLSERVQVAKALYRCDRGMQQTLSAIS